MIPNQSELLQTDKYFILDSRIVLLDAADSSLMIPIIIGDQVEGNIRINFHSSGEEKGIRRKVDNDTLVLECFNLDEPLGSFTIEPLELGDYEEKKLSIHLWSSLNGNDKTLRIVQYSLFMEK